jgi:anti-anti-sigma factor
MVVISCADASDAARRVAESEGLAQTLGPDHVVVDVGRTAMLDASTLALLKRFGGDLRSRGGELTVVCAHPGLADLLRLTQLSRSFHVVSTLDAALGPS